MVDELHKRLELAAKMINHVGCVNPSCDRKGAIQVAEDEWEPCQWCHERDLINKTLEEYNKRKPKKYDIVTNGEFKAKLIGDPYREYKAHVIYLHNEVCDYVDLNTWYLDDSDNSSSPKEDIESDKLPF